MIRRAATLAAGGLLLAGVAAGPAAATLGIVTKPALLGLPASTCCRFRCPTPTPSCTTGSCTSIARACWPTTSTPTAISWRRGWSRARRTVTWTSTTTGRSRTSRTTATRAWTASPTRRTTARSASPRWSRSRSPTSRRLGHNDHYTTKEGVKIQVDRPGVLKNDDDADGDHLRAKLVSGPDHGKLDLHDEGEFDYEPAQGFSGTDVFTYRAIDGADQSAVIRVVIDVDPKATPPPTPDADARPRRRSPSRRRPRPPSPTRPTIPSPIERVSRARPLRRSPAADRAATAADRAATAAGIGQGRQFAGRTGSDDVPR